MGCGTSSLQDKYSLLAQQAPEAGHCRSRLEALKSMHADGLIETVRSCAPSWRASAHH